MQELNETAETQSAQPLVASYFPTLKVPWNCQGAPVFWNRRGNKNAPRWAEPSDRLKVLSMVLI